MCNLQDLYIYQFFEFLNSAAANTRPTTTLVSLFLSTRPLTEMETGSRNEVYQSQPLPTEDGEEANSCSSIEVRTLRKRLFNNKVTFSHRYSATY